MSEKEDPELSLFKQAGNVWIDCGKGSVYRVNATHGAARLIRYFSSLKAAEDFKEIISKLKEEKHEN